MKYVAPIGAAGPNDPYIDGNPGTGTEGSTVPAAAIEQPLREIEYVITQAGLVANQAILTQLHQAIGIMIASVPTVSRALTGIQGMILSNNGADANNDIDIAPGACLSDDFTTLITLAAGITKRSDAAFATGTNNGSMDAGAKPSSGTLHYWAIYNPTTLATDIICSTSATAPTLPGGFTKKRCLGAVTTDGSSNIRAFKQEGDYFEYVNPILDIDTTSLTSANRTARTLTVPNSKKVRARFRFSFNDNASTSPQFLLFTSADQADQAPSNTANPLTHVNDNSSSVSVGELEIWTNTSRQIYDRSNSTTAGYLKISTLGYHYPRSL